MSRVVVLTGASSGLGRALTLRLGAAGDHLVLIARREEMLRDTAEVSGAAAAIVGSVSDPDVWTKVVHAVDGIGGEEIVLINNAGIAKFGAFHESDFADWREQIETNMIGALGLTHALLPSMLARGAGRVVNILSIVLRVSLPGTAGYTAAKAGLEGASRALSSEYRRRGITFTNIYPGASDTSIWDSQAGHPPREQMIPEASLTDTVFDVLQTPRDRVVEEIVVTPPLGVL